MKTLTEIQKELAEISQHVRDVSNDVAALSRAQDSGDDGAARVARLMRSLDGLAKPEPLVVPELASMDEHFREVTLRVLCSVALYENTPTADQILWLQRIASGMNVSGRLEEYTRQAMELNPDTLGDFLSRLARASSRYYFMLDGLILATLGENPQSGLTYMSELANAIKIPPEDAKHIAFMAKAVVTQSLPPYREAKRVSTELTEELTLAPYLTWVAALREKYTGPTKFFRQGNVVLENYDIEVAETWEFKNCTSVEFKNCTFEGKNYGKLELNEVANVKITNCDVRDFANLFMTCNEANSFIVENCHFSNCYCEGSHGGIFCINRTPVQFIGNKFERCLRLK